MQTRHSKPRPSQRDPPLQADNEVFLVAEQRKARRRVEFLERDNTESPIMATEWLRPLPQAPSGLASPFNILAREWTRPTSQPLRAWQHENEDIRTYLNGFHQRIQQLEGQLTKDQRMIAELQASCRKWEQQHEQDRDDLRKMSANIGTLEQNCEMLLAESNKQRQTIAELKRDNAGLRTEGKKQRQTIAELDWDNKVLEQKCLSLEKGMRKVTGERDRYREERDRYGEELDDLLDLEQKCHSLEKGMGKVTGERDRYREERDRYGKERNDLLAKLPPSSYPAPARKTRRSSRSSHTTTTYVASSRGSSSKGRSS